MEQVKEKEIFQFLTLSLNFERVKIFSFYLSLAVIFYFVFRGIFLGFKVANISVLTVHTITLGLIIELRRVFERKNFKGKDGAIFTVSVLEYLYFITFLCGFVILAQYGAVWGKKLILDDSLFMKIDSLFFGFNWFKFNHLIVSSPILTTLTRFIYDTITPLPIVLTVALLVKGDENELARFIVFMSITSALTVATFYFYPLVGPVKDYHMKTLIDFSYLPTIKAASSKMGTYMFGIHSLDGFNKTVSPDGVYYMTGAICLPSYHAVLALGIPYFFRSFGKKVLIVFLVLGVLMSTAAIPAGNHYLADIIAGALVAGVGIILTPKEPKVITKLLRGY